MSSQQQNTGNLGGNASANTGLSMGFSYATLATGPLGPTYDPLAEWEANVSRRDNPITDFLFESVALGKPGHTKSAQKKPAEKKSTQKKPKTK